MPTANVARVGFNVPNLDGEGEQRFEAGDDIPVDALTKKQLASLLEQGVVAKRDDDSPPELGWSQTAVMVDGVHLVEPDQNEVTS